MRILDPNRATYQKKYTDVNTCVFCERDEVLECPSLEGVYWRVLVNRFPYMDGNVMIVPQRHVSTTADLLPEEWQEFGVILPRVQEVLGQIFETASFNIGMNIGPESGASIPHLHWQVVPRKFKNVTVLNMLADLHIVVVTPESAQERIEAALNRESVC